MASEQPTTTGHGPSQLDAVTVDPIDVGVIEVRRLDFEGTTRRRGFDQRETGELRRRT
jgi:hypothetical protein